MNSINLVSVVVPVYNEEDNLPVLFEEIRKALTPFGKAWEVLFVDDGSSDGSLAVIKRLSRDHPEVRYAVFAENCGQSAAFSAGFAEAGGDVIVTLDADLQNDPADIPGMLRRYQGGFDMVIGWRAKRRDTLAKRLASKGANWIRNRLSRENVRDTGCSLKVMRASMAKRIPMYTGMHRFLPTLMKMQGAQVAEIRVNHRPRLHGTSKYGLLDRAMTTWYDLLAVRWMQDRAINYRIREKN